MTKNICLILRDGNEYSFIHKSIQEFFVANLLKSFDPAVLQKFYTDMFKGENHNNFEVELRFLSELDKLNYFKYLVVPSINNFFKDTFFIEKGIQPLLHSIFVTQNNPNTSSSVIILFNFDYEEKYGFINSLIMQNFFFYLIHYTDNVSSLHIYSKNEKTISDFEINELATLQLKQLVLSEKILDHVFITLDNKLKEAQNYIKSKTERSYKITR